MPVYNYKYECVYQNVYNVQGNFWKTGKIQGISKRIPVVTLSLAMLTDSQCYMLLQGAT